MIQRPRHPRHGAAPHREAAPTFAEYLEDLRPQLASGVRASADRGIAQLWIAWTLTRRGHSEAQVIAASNVCAATARTLAKLAQADPGSVPAASSPGTLPTPDSRNDQRGSRRMLLASALLHRGHDLADVAVLTDVPMAMLELMGEEHDRDDRRRIEALKAHQQRSRRARRAITMLVILEVIAAANVVACLTALLQRNAGLGLITGIVATVLTLALYLIAKPLTRPSTRLNPPT